MILWAAAGLRAQAGDTDAASVLRRDEAEQVTARLESLARPSAAASEFDKWAYDTALLTGEACWRQANPELQRPPQVFLQRRLRTASYRLPGDAELVRECRALAQSGFQPRCTDALVQLPGVRLNNGLPFGVVQFPADTVAMPGFVLEAPGSIPCRLTPGAPRPQHFPTRLQLQWIDAPALRTLPSPTGAVHLQAGTVWVRADGVPGSDGRPFAERRLGVVAP